MSFADLLRQTIYNRKGGLVTKNEIYDLCAKHNHLQSYAERALRKSAMPEVDTVYNVKHQVIGYKWITNGNIKTPERRTEQPNTPDIRTKGQELFAMWQSSLPSQSHLSQRELSETGI